MTTLPRTPSEGKLPLFWRAARFFPKGWGRCARKSVDCGGFFAKSLMLEQKCPTGFSVFSTGCASASTGCSVLSTDAVFWFRRPVSLYLSLFKKKKRRKEGLKGKTLIHGFEQLLKKVSTGFHPHPRLIRGYPWIWLFNCINGLSGIFGVSTHPRVVLWVGTLEGF